MKERYEITRTEYLKEFGFSFEGLIEPDRPIDTDFEEAFMEVYNALIHFEKKYIQRNDLTYM